MWVPLPLVCVAFFDTDARSLQPNRECLLEAYSMDSCPNCGKSLISSTELGEQQLLCTLANEGGVQDNLDILPILREESYLKAYPEERKCRAFLEFCAEGDVEAIVDLLNDDEDDDEDMAGTDKIAHNIDILRYTDQIGSMGSGLHVAVQNGKTEAAWMLLFLASTLDTTQIPQKMLEGAVELGVERDDQSGKVDIRSLKDSGGLTAEERAVQVGRPWQEWVQSGLLRTPQV